MITTHGKVRGRTIELDEDLGLAEGQQVEIQVRAVDVEDEKKSIAAGGAGGVYDVLGKRFESGYSDTAERHNEHQP